jgi:hypothetical protein
MGQQAGDQSRLFDAFNLEGRIPELRDATSLYALGFFVPSGLSRRRGAKLRRSWLQAS